MKTETKPQLSPEAISLLRKVQRAITKEPKRLNMGTWAKQDTDGEKTAWMMDEMHPDSGDEVEVKLPVCGTVGCIAGWTAVVGLPNLPKVVINGQEMVDIGGIRDVEAEARKLLGITKQQGQSLFLLPTWDRVVSRKDKAWPKQFSDAYAEAKTAKQKAKIACERIDYFIENLE